MPKDGSSVLVQRGRDAWEKGNNQEATARWAEALNMNPANAEACFLYATMEMQAGKLGASIPLLLRAIEGAPKAHEPLNNLGNCLKGVGKDDLAEETWLQALKVMKAGKEKDPSIYNNLASVTINAARAEEAEKWARKALEIDPKHPQGNWNCCLALLEQGRFREGWKQHEWGYFSGVRRNRQYDAGQWDGSKIDRLVLFGEQGQGDEILFASILNEVWPRAGEVIIDCHPRLQRLFDRTGKFTAIYPTRKEAEMAKWIYQHRPLDAKASLGDLPGLFRNHIEDFPVWQKTYEPFLATSPSWDEGLKWRIDNAAGPKPRVGITWEGGTTKTHCHQRTPEFAFFEDLVDALPQIEWFSVHYRNDAKERWGDRPVHCWPEVVNHFDGLTSLIGGLDLIITVDQTALHQAGAIGQECWVLMPHKCSWRFPRRVESRDGGFVDLPDSMCLWYGDDMRLMRQGEDLDWKPIFARLKHDLEDWSQGAAHAEYRAAFPKPIHLAGVPDPSAGVPQAAE